MRGTLILLLLSTSLYAQVDTAFIAYKDSVFWKVRITIGEDGEITTNEKPLGKDTLSVVNAIVGEAYPELDTYGNNTFNVLTNYRKNLRLVNATSATLQGIVNTTYTGYLESVIGDEFLGNYVMTTPTGNENASIIKLANGSLRYRQGTTNFAIDIITRNWFRIRRYDGRNVLSESGYVDFFTNGTIWVGASNLQKIDFILRKR